MKAAEVEILRAPDKSEMFVTTSHLYKRQLAEYFCEIDTSNQIALELGVYHGHTTAVLATIFKRVISVDIEKEYLGVAANHCEKHSNVIFLSMDLMADDWAVFTSNPVNVAIIDANHHYEHVLADAQNALRQMQHLEHLVFDDYNEEGVAHAVDELERAGVLVDCRGIGRGSDGSSWAFQDWDPATDTQFQRWTNRSEGKICKRGKLLTPTGSFVSNFADRRFYLYKHPLIHLCQAGVFRFLHNGTLLTSAWDTGQWTIDPAGRDVLLLHLPAMSLEPLEVIFNVGRTAFYVAHRGTLEPTWFGIGDHLVQRPFQLASNSF